MTNIPRADPVTKTLGNFGKWHLSAMLIVFLCKVPTSWFMAAVIFTAPAPTPGDYWCHPPPIVSPNYTRQWINKAQPKQINVENNITTIDYCRVYAVVWEHPMDFIGPNKSHIRLDNLTTIDCPHFAFKPQYISLVADYSLVCDRTFYVSLSQCCHISGLLIGGIIAYYLLK